MVTRKALKFLSTPYKLSKQTCMLRGKPLTSVNRADSGDGLLLSSVRGAGTNWVSGEERRERLGTETEEPRERGEDSRRIIQTGSDKLNQFIGSQSDLNYEPPMIHETDMNLRLIRVFL